MKSICMNKYESVEDALSDYMSRLDVEVANARARCSERGFLDDEVVVVESQAQEYRDRGYEGGVPDAIEVLAEEESRTPVDIAEVVLADRDERLNSMKQIRRIRLKTRSRLKSATTAREMDSLFNQASCRLAAI